MKKEDNNLKEFINTPVGKGILFFGFYFIFFIFVFIFIKTGGNHLTKADEYEKGNTQSFYVGSLESNNYGFTYTVTIDQIQYVYSGIRNQNTMSFVYNNQNYYYHNGKYYRNDVEWVECDNPIVYSEFLDVPNIISLLGSASYDSNTYYESGKINYSYLLSSNTINSIVYGINSDYFEEPNSVVIGIDEDSELNQILFHLDSFGMLNNISTKTFKITIEYDKFGEIKEIDNPIG